MQNTMLDSVVSSNLQELPNASSALKLFENPQFRVRVIMRCSEPWFVAKDVATCIEHSNVSKMCELCRDKDKAVVRPSDLTSNDLLDVKNREYTLISEAGLYRILAKCNLPKCEPFESWVFDEVLPSICKTGKYEAHPTIPSYMLESEEERAIAWAEEHRQARLALEAKEREIKSLQAQKDVLRQDYMPLKGFCNGLIAKGLAIQTNGKPYVIGTLKTKLSSILKTVSAKFGYSISEETVVVDGVERKTPYYHKDVCNMVEKVITPQWLRRPDASIITDEIYEHSPLRNQGAFFLSSWCCFRYTIQPVL